ncbi:MAG: hemolysin family protein [Beijerinckiaceae bacterium]
MSDDSSSQSRTEPDVSQKEPQQRSSVFSRLRSLLGMSDASTKRQELEEALDESDPETDFSPLERAMLRNVLALRQVKVDDVMVPRADINAISIDSTLGEVLQAFHAAGHSRLPVYSETLDDPRGMIHIRDFMIYLATRAESETAKTNAENSGGPNADQALSLDGVDLSRSLTDAKLFRPVLFVPASMPAIDLLVKMQATRTHMALVIDEYGGTEGLVSIEDLVEVIVGDIEDEHDESAGPGIRPESEGVFLADGRVTLEEVAEAFGSDVAGESGQDVDTLSGLILVLAGRVPVRGEIIRGAEGVEFEIVEADPRRVKRIRLRRRKPEAERSRRRQRTDTKDESDPSEGHPT